MDLEDKVLGAGQTTFWYPSICSKKVLLEKNILFLVLEFAYFNKESTNEIVWMLNIHFIKVLCQVVYVFSQISHVQVLLYSHCILLTSHSLPLQHLPRYNHHSCLGIKNQLSLSPTDTQNTHTLTCADTHILSPSFTQMHTEDHNLLLFYFTENFSK